MNLNCEVRKQDLWNDMFEEDLLNTIIIESDNLGKYKVLMLIEILKNELLKSNEEFSRINNQYREEIARLKQEIKELKESERTPLKNICNVQIQEINSPSSSGADSNLTDTTNSSEDLLIDNSINEENLLSPTLSKSRRKTNKNKLSTLKCKLNLSKSPKKPKIQTQSKLSMFYEKENKKKMKSYFNDNYANDSDATVCNQLPFTFNDTKKSKSPTRKSPGVKKRKFQNSYDFIPEKEDDDFQFKKQVLRKKVDRQNLPGYECDDCIKYFENLKDISPEQRQKRIDHCSRHRGLDLRSDTVPGYWNPDFSQTQESIIFNI